MRAYVVAALVTALGGVLVIGACMKKSEKYCLTHPDDVANCGEGSGSAACEVDQDCAATTATPVCELGQGVCVQCIEGEAAHEAACTGTTPICDGTSCRGCASDTECVSNVCGTDGACVATDQIAYVAETGTSTTCTQSMPCGELSDAEATERPHIKITGDVMLSDTTRFDHDHRVIHGAGASVTIPGGMAMIEIGSAGTALEIYDLDMTTTNGSDQPVIEAITAGAILTLERVKIHDASGHALEVPVDTMVTIHHSIIAFNDSDFPALNITSGQFEITNTIIVGNGSLAAQSGGARLAPTGALRVFEFNTVADNISAGAGTFLAVSCDDVTLESSIVSGGRIGLGCGALYNLYDVPTGTTLDASNRNGSPTFQDDTTVSSHMFYRLAPGSLGIDWADPAATLADDIDGDPRPAGEHSDTGADETP